MKQNHNVCPLSSCADKNHNTIGLRCQFHFPKKTAKTQIRIRLLAPLHLPA